MKKILLTILAAGIFAATTAQGRIGWTLEQCKAQYGNVIADRLGDLKNEKLHWYTFWKEDVEIEVVLLEGKCFRITYKKLAYPWWTKKTCNRFSEKTAMERPGK